MPSPVPTPVAAALGLVPTVLDGVRRLPSRAAALPVHAVSHALTSLDSARSGYDALAERGERLLARLRGTSFDELEDRVEDALQSTPLAAPYDRLEDALEDASERVTAIATGTAARARKAAGTTARTAGKAADTAADAVEDAAQAVGGAAEQAAGQAGDLASDLQQELSLADAVPDAEAPKGAPTPKATEPDSTRIDTAASPDVVQAVEQVSATVGGPVLDHDQLPLPDYDHMTLGSLRGRMRSLDLPQLVQIRDYEKAHADRLPIVTMLDNRIAKLAADPTAPLSGSDPASAATAPDKPRPAKKGSRVQPQTGGPAQNPPSQGDPTNPAQPRSSGSGSTNPA